MNQPEQAPRSPMSSPEIDYFDVLEGFDIDDAAQQITKIEAEANALCLGLPRTVEEDGLPSEPLDELGELFFLSDPKKAVFTGLVYGVRDDNQRDDDEYQLEIDTDAVEMLVDTEVTFEGPEYTEIEEAQRIVFALKRTIVDKVTKQPASTRYATFVRDIWRLEYMQEPLLTMLARHSIDAKMLVTSRDFLNAHYDQQIATLKELAVTCYNELVPYLDDEDVEVVCESSITRKDAKKGNSPKLVTYKQAGTFIEGSLLRGCMYPDTINRGEHPFRSLDDFTHGVVPHIAIRDDKAATTTYIAIDKITAIE